MTLRKTANNVQSNGDSASAKTQLHQTIKKTYKKELTTMPQILLDPWLMRALKWWMQKQSQQSLISSNLQQHA